MLLLLRWAAAAPVAPRRPSGRPAHEAAGARHPGGLPRPLLARQVPRARTGRGSSPRPASRPSSTCGARTPAGTSTGCGTAASSSGTTRLKALVYNLGRSVGPLVKYYRGTGYGPALDLAVALKEKLIEDVYLRGRLPRRRPVRHTTATPRPASLSSLAQLADLTNDSNLMDRVRKNSTTTASGRSGTRSAGRSRAAAGLTRTTRGDATPTAASPTTPVTSSRRR